VEKYGEIIFEHTFADFALKTGIYAPNEHKNEENVLKTSIRAWHSKRNWQNSYIFVMANILK
jgi:hypothetical protein